MHHNGRWKSLNGSSALLLYRSVFLQKLYRARQQGSTAFDDSDGEAATASGETKDGRRIANLAAKSARAFRNWRRYQEEEEQSGEQLSITAGK